MKICPACKNENIDSVEICHVCEFPFNGTESEKSIHIGKFIGKKGITYDADYHLERSKKIILSIAVINLLMMIFYSFNGFFNLFSILIDSIVIGVFTFCGLTIRKNPTLKILLALSTYLTINLIVFLLNPNSLLQGILIKIAIVGSLIYSMYLVNASDKFTRKFGS